MGKKEKMVEKNKPFTAAKTTTETTTTMDMMHSFIRRNLARHEPPRKFALGVVSYVRLPGVLLNDKIDNVEVPVVVLKKNTLSSNKNTCDVDVHEAPRKFDFGVVPDVEVPNVLLNDEMNSVDVTIVVLKKKNTVGGEKNIFDVGVPGVGIHDVEVPAVGLKKKIYDVEVPAVGMINNISSTVKKRKFTGE